MVMVPFHAIEARYFAQLKAMVRGSSTSLHRWASSTAFAHHGINVDDRNSRIMPD
jgi:hypothetical protein